MYSFSNPSKKLPPLPAAFGPIFPITPPPEAGWSWVNQETAEVIHRNRAISLYTPLVSGDHYRLYLQAVPSKPYTVDTCIAVTNPGYGGIGWYSSVSGRIALFGIDSNPKMNLLYYNNPVPTGGLVGTNIYTSLHGRNFFARIHDEAAHRQTYYSLNGIDWILFSSTATDDYVTPTHIGLILQSNGSPVGGTILSCFSWKVY